MKRPALLILCALIVAANTSSVRGDDRPNVLVILTDDQGWGDLRVSGNTNLSTPNIDSLARDGTTFRHFYVCQVCAPTRAEFLTGRYYPKTGVSGVSTGQERLNVDETTIANLFQAAGYATGAFGKWHNGTQSPYHPLDRGFDQFYGFTSGHWGHYFSPPLDHNGRTVRGNGFIVDDVTDHAIEFIRENLTRPFFCYVPLNTPHSPMMVPDRFYEKFDGAEMEMKHRDPEREDVMMTRAALALCENIDWNVGRLLQTVRDANLQDDTIVIYFSDNGPNSFRWNGGMKGRKGSIDEGGLRVPGFIRWPGRIPAGRVVEPIAAAIDLLPTLSTLCGVTDRASRTRDGADLSTLLSGRVDTAPDRLLFSIKNHQVSVRNQRFRLDADGKLFDIANDPGQETDVSANHRRIAKDLLDRATEHGEDMQRFFERFSDRPFTVGYGPSTTLPARDGVPHGGIRRSSKAPNNSFFTAWKDERGSVTWDIEVGESAEYEVIANCTCSAGNEGVTLRLGVDGGPSTESVVGQVFDPPLYDKSKERVEESHYFVKDFRPLSLGVLRLDAGRSMIRLTAKNLQGSGVVDVHSLVLRRK